MTYQKFFNILMWTMLTLSVVFSATQMCLQFYKTRSIETELIFVTIAFLLISLSAEIFEVYTNRGTADAN